MATIRLDIITPEKIAFSKDVDNVTLPGSEGEFGVWPSHAPLMTKIKPGELKVSLEGQQEFLAVGEGFVEVTGTRVRVLTDMAIEETQIDESQAEAAMERARKALAEAPEGSEQMEALMAEIQRTTAQIQLKRRRKSV